MKESATNSKKTRTVEPEMRAEYDFTGGVRGKYYQQYIESTNVVVLEPDVAAGFRTAEAVNSALRALLRVALDNPVIAPQVAKRARKAPEKASERRAVRRPVSARAK